MVSNKQELLSAAAEWSNRAKNDIRTQLMNFMSAVGATEEKIADVIGLSLGEVEQILRGNGEITLSAFAKLLIATDHMIEIKPMNDEVLCGVGVNPLHEEEKVEEREHVSSTQPRDSHGRFCRKDGTNSANNGFSEFVASRTADGTPTEEHDTSENPFEQKVGKCGHFIDLDSLSKEELVFLAQRDGIRMDFTTACRGEIIEALEENQKRLAECGQISIPECREERHVVRHEEPSHTDAHGEEPSEEGSAKIHALLDVLREIGFSKSDMEEAIRVVLGVR